MKTISARRRLYALLVIPFVLLLAGCGKMHAEFEVKDVDSMQVSFDMGFKPSFVESEFDNAQAMCDDIESDEPIGTVTIEAYEEDGLWGCRFSGPMERSEFGSGMELAESDGEYHLTMDMGSEALTQADLDMFASLYGADVSDFDFKMTFTFPGKVLESQGGTIDGNTVTYTDIVDFYSGVDITAESGGFPWLIVIIIVVVLGFLLLLVLAAIIFFVIRARRKKTSNGASGTGVPAAFGGAAAGAASMPSGNTPPATPQNGQQWGQASPPPAAPQDGQQWGQASPPAAAPQDGQQWGQASPPPAAPQDGQQWGQASPPAAPPSDQDQPWNQQRPDSENPQGGNQPPQNPGW